MSNFLNYNPLQFIGRSKHLLSYGVAAITTLITLLMMLLLNTVIDISQTPFLLFFVPVIISTFYGGLISGILSIVLTALAITYFFIPPAYSLFLNVDKVIRLSLFVIQAVTFSILISLLQTSRQKAQTNLEKLQTKKEQLNLALDAAQMVTWDINITSGKITWSNNQQQIFGINSGYYPETYSDFLEFIHPEDRELVIQKFNHALRSKIDYEDDFRIIQSNHNVRWLSARGKSFYDENSIAIRMTGIVQDITERKEKENLSQFLFEASNVLASSLDYETTLTSVVHLAVPKIADWCAIDLLEESGKIKRLAVAHIDPDKVDLAYELYRRYPPNLDDPKDRVVYVINTGQSELVTEIPDSLIVDIAYDAEHLRIIRELNLKSYILVPLIARGRTLGVITFVTAESGKKYQHSDLALAEELAQRAALAIDNAKLFRTSEETRQIAQEAERRKDETLALLDTLLLSAPIGLAFFDTNLRCVRINDYLSNINGVSVQESIGKTMKEFLPEMAEIVEPILHKVIETKQPILNVEISGETKGTVGQQHALANYYPVYAQNGEILGIGVAISNITKLKQTTEILREYTIALQKQQEWLEDILNLLPIPLLFIEPETAKVIFANKAADELAGGKFPQGKAAEEYHTLYYCTDAKGDRIPDEQMPGVRVAKGERLKGFEMNWCTPAGIRSLLIDGDVLPTMRGHPAIGIVVFQDVSKLKQIEKALLEANRMKDEFLAVVSHELRSPLNSILGWAQMLRSQKLNPVMTAKALETIERNARSQTQLIEDLLDVSRIITGKLRLNIYPIKLSPIIDAAIDTMRLAADTKEISLSAIVDSTVTVSGDSERLQQVVWNLLSNAIKFTPTGGKVEIQLCRQGSQAVVTVSDTGIGIKPDFLPYVFERFRQADSTTTRTYGGLGLGLAIVRNLVELHGGTIGVSSLGEGQGTTFTIKLPLQSSTPSSIQNPEHPLENSAVDVETTQLDDQPDSTNTQDLALTNLRVLVVDDEADTREFLSVALTSSGAQVKTAASVSQALAMIVQWLPDVLVSDIGMPGEDGYSLIRQVRSLSVKQGGTIPALALTAYARSEDRQRALLEGFQMHLPKPIEPTKLTKAVASLVGRTNNSSVELNQ